jgi:shikimate kinase
MPLIDTDQLVEEVASMTIAQIFADGGESEFRDRETRAIETVISRSEAHIVSLGGGAILRDSNRKLIVASGWTAWLTASAEVLAKRIAGDPLTQRNRPALTKLGELDEIRAMLNLRTPYYSQTANAIYNTDTVSLEQLATQVASDYEHWVRDRKNII